MPTRRAARRVDTRLLGAAVVTSAAALGIAAQRADATAFYFCPNHHPATYLLDAYNGQTAQDRCVAVYSQHEHWVHANNSSSRYICAVMKGNANGFGGNLPSSNWGTCNYTYASTNYNGIGGVYGYPTIVNRSTGDASVWGRASHY